MKKITATRILSAALILCFVCAGCDRDSTSSQTGDEVETAPTVDAEAGREVFKNSEVELVRRK